MNRGRPKKEESEKRNVEIKIRLTQEENEKIEKLAERLKMNKSKLIRNVLLGEIKDVEILTNIGLIPIVQSAMAFYEKNFKGNDYYENLKKEN